MLLTIAVDANPTLAALLGGYARTILFDPRFCFLTTSFTMSEVGGYLSLISTKSGVSVAELELALSLLPIEIIERSSYGAAMSKSKRYIEDIDPDDVDILALAIHENIPLWTNDRDFIKASAPIRIIQTKDFIL